LNTSTADDHSIRSRSRQVGVESEIDGLGGAADADIEVAPVGGFSVEGDTQRGNTEWRPTCLPALFLFQARVVPLRRRNPPFLLCAEHVRQRDVSPLKADGGQMVASVAGKWGLKEASERTRRSTRTGVPDEWVCKRIGSSFRMTRGSRSNRDRELFPDFGRYNSCR